MSVSIGLLTWIFQSYIDLSSLIFVLWISRNLVHFWLFLRGLGGFHVFGSTQYIDIYTCMHFCSCFFFQMQRKISQEMQARLDSGTRNSAASNSKTVTYAWPPRYKERKKGFIYPLNLIWTLEKILNVNIDFSKAFKKAN